MLDTWDRPDEIAAEALLNCLIRELAEPVRGDAGLYRLLGSGRLLRVTGGNRPRNPVLDGRPVGGLDDLIALACAEAASCTGQANPLLADEIRDSRDVVAALLAARRTRPDWSADDLYLRSEQALLTGHRYHPAPKRRGTGDPASWLPYAPEAGARFPLVLLGVPEELFAGEGDTSALDAVWGAAAPPGYRVLPAHPWQLHLVTPDQAALVRRPGEPLSGRIRGYAGAVHGAVDAADATAGSGGVALGALRVPLPRAPGTTGGGGVPVPLTAARGTGGADAPLLWLGETTQLAYATSSLRTVYLPELDLSLKFSLDVRITNDIRRLWLRDLRWLAAIDELLAELPTHSQVLADTGYRTAAVGGQDGYEAFAVLQREGHRRWVRRGLTPLLAAGVCEGFPGNPLDGLDAAGALEWWRRYVTLLAPTALEACFDHGVVLESHLQNVLVAVDADGMPGEVLFRDHEGVKLLRERHGALLRQFGPDVPTPGISHTHGQDRLMYCLLTNNLMEMAASIAARHPGLDPELWRTARQILAPWPEVVSAPSLPGKTNLLLRWRGADGGDSAYRPLANPLRG